MMVWIMGPENEEVRVLFSMAEGALTLKKKKIRSQSESGLVTNAKRMGLLKTSKRT